MRVLKNLFGNNTKISADNIAIKDNNKGITLNEYLDSKIIYDSGSNSNGSWIRFNDGTMVCTKNLIGTTGRFNLWANGTYYMDIQNGNWPLSFTKLDDIQVTNAHNQMWCCCSNHSLVSAGVTRLVRPDDGGSGQNYNINIMGIGKWK